MYGIVKIGYVLLLIMSWLDCDVETKIIA